MCSRRLRPRDPYHRVAGDQLRQLFFSHALCSCWALRKDHVADLGTAVPDPDLGRLVELQAELLQHLPRLDHHPRPVGWGLVPDRRQPEYRPRIAGTEGTDDDVVDGRCILDHHHVLALPSAKTEFGNGWGGVSKEAFLVCGDHFVYSIGREQPLLEQDGLQRPGACFHVREWSWMMTVFTTHWLITSSCS